MKKTICFAALALFVFSTASEAQSGYRAEIPQSLRAQVDASVAKVKPALVRITVVSTAYREGREIKFQASGSGAIITPEGHVITNHHVAGNAKRLKCTLSTKEEVDAVLIGQDALTDLAIIKLTPEDDRRFPIAHFGDSDLMQVGDPVLAMGSPLALSQSVTLGIMSNTELIFPENRWGRFTLDGEDVGSLVRWFGHDAVILPGNSGGPLVNLDGEIIGINEISVGFGGGLGGAIPGNLARKIGEELRVNGEVRRSFIGMVVQPRLTSSGLSHGVLVGSVIEGAPAAKAGLEPGDIILEFNEEPIDVRFQEQIPLFNGMVAELEISESVEVVALRNGEEKTFEVTPISRMEASPQPQELREWGATVRDISFLMAKEMKRDTTEGVAITSVRAGGPVGEAKPSLQSNDIIVEVNDKKVEDLDALREMTESILKDTEDTVPVLVTFERKEERMVTVASIGIQDLQDPSRQVTKAWLPVETQVLTRDIAENYDDDDLKGFIVTYVYEGSTADEAGLKVGDAILEVDGMDLEASRPEDYEVLDALIRQYKIGTEAELTLLRRSEGGGEREEERVSVKLVESPKAAREMARYRSEEFEFTVRDVTTFDRAEEKLPEDRNGVVVDEVRSGGWAALGNLNVGDFVLEINGKGTPDVKATEAIMDEIVESEPEAVVIRVLRGIHTVFLEIEPKWDGDEA